MQALTQNTKQAIGSGCCYYIAGIRLSIIFLQAVIQFRHLSINFCFCISIKTFCCCCIFYEILSLFFTLFRTQNILMLIWLLLYFLWNWLFFLHEKKKKWLLLYLVYSAPNFRGNTAYTNTNTHTLDEVDLDGFCFLRSAGNSCCCGICNAIWHRTNFSCLYVSEFIYFCCCY